MNARETAIVCFDVEMRGISAIRHGMNALGACCLRLDGSVVSTFFASLSPLPGQDYEKRCYDEFWSKNLDVLSMLEKRQRPAQEGIERWYKYLADLNGRYEIKLVCDAPYYDIPTLGYYLDYFGYPPLCYKAIGGYTPEKVANVIAPWDASKTGIPDGVSLKFTKTLDILGYAMGVVGASPFSSFTKERAVHKIWFTGDAVYDHNPTNDAHYNGLLFLAYFMESKARNARALPGDDK